MRQENLNELQLNREHEITNIKIIEKIRNKQAISRREFIQLLPDLLRLAGIGTIIALAAKIGIKILDEENKRPQTIKVHEAQVTKTQPLIKSLTETNQNLPSQSTTDPLDGKNLENNKHVDSNERLVTLATKLKYLYSPKRSEINPLVTGMVHGSLPNFDEMPEVIAARKLPNIQERILAMIKILGVNTQEELKLLYEINDLEQKINLICKVLDGLSHNTDEISKLITFDASERDQIIMNTQDILWEQYDKLSKKTEDYWAEIVSMEQEIIENAGNPAWNSEVISFCNLYATTLLAALGLLHRISHRVDKNGNPVESGGRELNARGMFNWFKEHGSRFGWKDVSNITHKERMELLRNGAIFYGSTIDHNWIIFGMNVNGSDFRPVLTQATYNKSIGLFPDVTEKESIPMLENLYKIIPTEGCQLWSIFVDDAKNPLINN